jgi:hypothetical protein
MIRNLLIWSTLGMFPKSRYIHMYVSISIVKVYLNKLEASEERCVLSMAQRKTGDPSVFIPHLRINMNRQHKQIFPSSRNPSSKRLSSFSSPSCNSIAFPVGRTGNGARERTWLTTVAEMTSQRRLQHLNRYEKGNDMPRLRVHLESSRSREGSPSRGRSSLNCASCWYDRPLQLPVSVTSWFISRWVFFSLTGRCVDSEQDNQRTVLVLVVRWVRQLATPTPWRSISLWWGNALTNEARFLHCFRFSETRHRLVGQIGTRRHGPGSKTIIRVFASAPVVVFIQIGIEFC